MNKIKFTLVKKSGQQTTPAQKQSALTPAEMNEAARFRALTATRAARQAMLYRIMSEVEELDQVSPAA